MARPTKFRLDDADLSKPLLAARLAAFVEEIERKRERIRDLQSSVAETYDVLDAEGFDKAAVRQVVAKRSRDPDVVQRNEDHLTAYEFAVERGFSSRARASGTKSEAISTAFATHNFEDQPAPPTGVATLSERVADESSDTIPQSNPGGLELIEAAAAGALVSAELPAVAAPSSDEVLSADRAGAPLSVIEVAAPPRTDLDEESREDVGDRGIPVASEATAGTATGETAAPQSMTSLADARLIQRVRNARSKGMQMMDAGDSARVKRLIAEGALVESNGKLFLPTLRRAG